MFEVIFCGRGGQGAVTAVELIALAAIAEGKWAQGFPSFGPERRGAPVMAFLRVSEHPIHLRERIENPDVVVVMDPTLIGFMDIDKGLKMGGTLIINSPSDGKVRLEVFAGKYRVVLLDASRIALESLGAPIANTAILGALIKATRIVEIHTLEDLFRKRFGRQTEKNLNALRRAYDETSTCAPLPLPDPDESAGDAFACKNKPAVEALHPWTEIEIGCDVVRPGSTAEYSTGSWRSAGRPEMNKEKCNRCGICWIMCPDIALRLGGGGFYEPDERYCKGCGICAEECPKGAIDMREEQ